MVIISFSYPGSLSAIFNKEKITTIRLFNEKWKKVYRSFLDSKQIPLQFYYKQRSKFGFKFLESFLIQIEKFNLENLTEKIAKLDGAKNKEVLLSFFNSNYGDSYFKAEYVRIFWCLDFKPDFNAKNIVINKIINFSDGLIQSLIENDSKLFNMNKFKDIQNIIKNIEKRGK